MTTIAQHTVSALENFSKLIESIPGEEHQQEAQDQPRDEYSVRTTHGWGEKYTKRIELTGEKWHAAFQDALAAIEKRGIVAFLGKRGPGKTQMAAEIARLGKWPNDEKFWNGHYAQADKTALYRRAMDIFLELRDAAQNDSGTSEKRVLSRLESVGLLVIDEFQERGGTEWEGRILCNLLDKRYAAERPTIIIANYTREEMAAALSPSIKDRIRENGRAIIFDWESFRAAKIPAN